MKQHDGMRLAIDLSEYLYVYYNIAKKNMFEMNQVTAIFENGSWKQIDEEMVQYYVCRQFISLVEQFKKNSMIPIFVFDGKPNIEKKSIVEARKKKSLDNKKLRSVALTDETSFETYKLAELRCNVPSREYKLLLSALFTSLRVIFYHAEFEADTLCSQLCRNGMADGVLSQDGDQFAYNTRLIVKNIKIIEGTSYMTFTYSNLLHKMFNLTPKQLTMFCVMNGSDYNQNITNFGPVKNLKLLREHGVIETICKIEPKFSQLDYHDAYNIFTCDITIPSMYNCDICFMDKWTNTTIINYFVDLFKSY